MTKRQDSKVKAVSTRENGYAEEVSISRLKANPSNPRVMRDDRFAKLKKSITEFPDMLNKRPIVAVTDKDGKLMVLGGNMRLRACQDLGLKTVPVVLADDWTEEQRRRFIIADNVGFGEWDGEMLANEWDAVELAEWGLDLPPMDEPSDDDVPPADPELYKPYSVINRQADGWPDRSSELKALMPVAMGRDAQSTGNLIDLTQGFKEWSGNDTGTSMFDPCLAEWAYTLFTPKSILDPFCGGPPRGYVAAMMDIPYKGFDVRAEQIEVNMQRVGQFGKPPQYIHSCYTKYEDPDTYDMVFTCPPYGDLEQYSKQADDISSLKPEEFITMYRAILTKAWERINVNGHMAVVIGNYRRKKSYMDLEVLTKGIMTECGGDIIGDCIVVDPIGSKAMIGKHHLQNYGVITRCHQYLIIARKNKE